MFHKKCKTYYCLTFFCLFLLLLEEYTLGIVSAIYSQIADKEFFHVILKNRTVEIRLPIAVVTIFDKSTDFPEFTQAQNTLECYCKHFGYPLIRIFIDQSNAYNKFCPHKNGFFKRHCVLTMLMKKYAEYEYFLFLDADIGVLNPNHLLEEYINVKNDLTFYSRIFNIEITAGSYFAKNTEYARAFLMDWANYEYKLPNSYNGDDNAAIHQVFVDRFVPLKKNKCRSIWEASTDWDGVAKFVACSKVLLRGQLKFDSIEIRPKYSDKVWSRDAFISDSFWSLKDFMIHGWKTSTEGQRVFAKWYNPLRMDDRFDMSKCNTARAVDNWIYLTSFIKSNAVIGKMIKEQIAKSDKKFKKIFRNLN